LQSGPSAPKKYSQMKVIIIVVCHFLFASTALVFGQDINLIRNSLGKYYGLGGKSLIEWRNDSTGCNGKRSNSLSEIFDNKLLIGMPKDLFLVFFGNPNRIDKDGEVFIYYVTITCDKSKKQINNTEYFYLIVGFKDGKVELIERQIT
jgi:hypothetical protein